MIAWDEYHNWGDIMEHMNKSKERMTLAELLKDNTPDGYCKECGKPFWFSFIDSHRKIRRKKFCNKECTDKYDRREYYKKYRKQIRYKAKLFYKEHRNQKLQYYRNYYLKNKKRILQVIKDWRKRNPDKVKLYKEQENKKRREARKEKNLKMKESDKR